jgi:enolase
MMNILNGGAHWTPTSLPEFMVMPVGMPTLEALRAGAERFMRCARA